MKIRSITYFLNPGWPLDDNQLRNAGGFIEIARPAFEHAGYEVQTASLATSPFPGILPSLALSELIDFAGALERLAPALGYEYVSLGPALPDNLENYHLIPEVLAATENIFLSGLMTAANGIVSIPAVRLCAEVIHQAAVISPDGFTNLRFAALANVPPGAPFFPAAYHNGMSPTFAIATEAADLAVEAFSNAESLEEGRRRLVQSIEDHSQGLTNVGENLSDRLGLPFGGIDFTLAPYPEEQLSFGTALERLGVPAVGLHGSLASAAILASTLDQACFPRAGFNGLMLPVLEDATLAARAAEGSLSVKD